MLRVRPPAVAGSFYPADPGRLAADISSMLSAASVSPSDRLPKAIVAPHAGYVYSGPIAASAFACLRKGRDQIRRVVVLGPAHRVYVAGLALPEANAFDTPLGRLNVAVDAVAPLGLPRNAAAHAREHSLEVELPFLQSVLTSFDIIPIAVGDAGAEEVATVIEALWGGPETLIVVSSRTTGSPSRMTFHSLPVNGSVIEDLRTMCSVRPCTLKSASRSSSLVGRFCGANPPLSVA